MGYNTKEECWCGFSAHRGTQIIGALIILSSILSILTTIYFLIFDPEGKVINLRQLPTTFILSARILGIVSCLVGIAFTCSMLYGLRVKRPSLYMPYLVWTMVWIVALCVFIVLVVVLVVLALIGVISDVKLHATVLWILGIASTQIPMLLFCVAYFLFIVPYRSRKMLVEGQY